MTQQEFETAFDRAMNLWAEAGGLNNPRQMHAKLESASGHLTRALDSSHSTSAAFGVGASFYYSYAVFLNQQMENPKMAEKMLVIAQKFATKALAMDPQDFRAHLFQATCAGDVLVATPQPSTFNTLRSNESTFKKFFKASFDLTAFSTAKSSYLKAIAALTASFQAKTGEGSQIEVCVDAIEQIFNLIDATLAYDFDYSNVYQAIADVNLEHMVYGCSDEEVEALVNQLEGYRDDAYARLSLQRR